MTKTEAKEPSRFSGGDSFITHRAYIVGRLRKGNYTLVKPCFFTKSDRFGRTELSISRICAESRDLEFEHGFRACSLRDKRNKSDFHILGGQKTKKK